MGGPFKGEGKVMAKSKFEGTVVRLRIPLRSKGLRSQ